MQTFLPYADIYKSSQCLDNKRLGKQRVEAWQILNVLTNPEAKQGWKNHPAVLMWKGYEHILADYGLACCVEWRARGFVDNMAVRFINYLDNCFSRFYDDDSFSYEYPVWFGVEQFHSSHRSNLLRKLPDHYSKFGWSEGPDLPYWWPTKEFQYT